MQIKTTMRYYLTPVRTATKKDKNKQVLERMWEKKEPFCTVGGSIVGAATVENSMEVPGKIKNKNTIWTSNCILCIYPKKMKTLIGRDICTLVSTAALFTKAEIWRQPKSSSIDEWIKKMWYRHIMEYYSAIKKKEILPFVITWMDLEGIMLSKISQRKTNRIMISLICRIQQTNRPLNSENKLMVARGEVGWKMAEIGEGDKEIQISSYKISKLWRWKTHHRDYRQ